MKGEVVEKSLGKQDMAERAAVQPWRERTAGVGYVGPYSEFLEDDLGETKNVGGRKRTPVTSRRMTWRNERTTRERSHGKGRGGSRLVKKKGRL